MLVGDLLAYIDIFSVLFLLGVLSRIATVLFIIKQASALAGRDACCVEALDLFVSIYGAEAGNLALKAFAVGGVFIGGGIGPKIRAKLLDGTFMTAFGAKGRLSPLLATIPVKLALEPRAALLGAAQVGADLVVMGRLDGPPKSNP